MHQPVGGAKSGRGYLCLDLKQEKALDASETEHVCVLGTGCVKEKKQETEIF